MEIRQTLKLAAGAAALFCLGAGVTAAALGTLPIGFARGALSRVQVEQVVHDYLLAHPDVLVEMTNKLQAQEAAATQKARSDALFAAGVDALSDPKVAYVAGPKDAKVTVAEFFDYRCPHCKASLAAMQNLMANNKNVRVAFIERPILTPDSVVAAHAAVASRRQGEKYIAFHNALMATQGELPKERILDIAKGVGLDIAQLERDMADPVVAESVNASNALANKLHFEGTPTFVVNGKIIVGELTAAELQNLAQQAAGGNG